MRFKMMAVAACVVLAAPAIAQTADSTPVPKPKKEKKICRTEPALSGTRMPNTICRTQSQWTKSDAAGGDNTGMPGVRSTSGDGASADNR